MTCLLLLLGSSVWAAGVMACIESSACNASDQAGAAEHDACHH